MESKRTSLSTKAYNALKEKIMKMELNLGVPLSEKRLASELNMTRTPVREAIHRLKHEGLLKVIPRRGTFVNSLSVSEIRQIYEMAEALESMAASLAAERVSNEDIDRLQKILTRMKKALANKDMDNWIEADLEFHECVIEIARNKYIGDAMRKINDQIHRARLLYIRIKGEPIQSTRDHERMMEAIASHDAQLVRKLTREHIRRIREEQVEILSGLGKI